MILCLSSSWLWVKAAASEAARAALAAIDDLLRDSYAESFCSVSVRSMPWIRLNVSDSTSSR